MIIEEKIANEEKSANGFRIENVSRRRFLQGALSASAFVLCVAKSPLLAKAARNGAPGSMVPITPGSVPTIDSTVFHPGVFLGIQTDGTVLIVAHRTEMGNGVRTSLPRIVADELDADWSRVKAIQGDGDQRYGSQDTDGSHSVREFFDPLREAGATARLMLVAKAWWLARRQGARSNERLAAERDAA